MQHRPIKAGWREIAAGSFLILLLSALSYLLLAKNFGFYNDDWYLVYTGLVDGSGKFIEVFAGDRPFRAYFVGFMFDLFGLNAPLYSYASYVLRVSGAFAMFWLLWQLWPRQKRLVVLLATLFAIYPGWTDQPSAYDYQSHLLSFALEVFSLALTVYAWREQRLVRKVVWTALAVLSQAISLLMMEYYIGMEGLRLLLLLYLTVEQRPFSLARRTGRPRLRPAALAWLPYLAGAGGFFIWRVFFFQNTRSATDIGGMFDQLLQSPIHRGLQSITYLVQDFFNVTFVAWALPLNRFAFSLRLRDALVALGLGLLASAIVWAAWVWMRRGAEEPEELPSADEGSDMFWLGALGVLLALVPIVLGNRRVIFPDFSRFSLPGSVGAVMVLGGLLLAVRRERVRVLLVVVLAGLTVVTHYGNSVNFANNWDAVRNFWWQVSWRAPQIMPETVLTAQYSSGAIYEDYFVWGPANLVYYPNSYRPEGETRTPLAAVVLTKENIQAIQMGLAMGDRERRGIYSTQDMGQTLVMTMPETGSCVHVMDGRAPELSHLEEERTFLIAGSSNAQRIMLDEPFHTPPAALFGAEPPHTWCYYYQKGSLARQRGDWAEVDRLGDEAVSQGLHPLDWVEWMPFIQAAAYLGDYEKVDRIYPIIADIRYLKYQACQLFTDDALGNQARFPEGQQYLQQKFCP